MVVKVWTGFSVAIFKGHAQDHNSVHVLITNLTPSHARSLFSH